MLSKLKLNQLYFKDTQFVNLMTRRIFNVLLIANPYDAFMLEDDGRVDEKIFNDASDILATLGLDINSAVRMFLQGVVLHNGIPFRPAPDTRAGASGTGPPRNQSTSHPRSPRNHPKRRPRSWLS